MLRKLFAFLLLATLVGACNYTQKVRDGRTAFEVKQYAVAAKMLEKDYDKAKSRVEKGRLAFLIGESYRRQNRSDLSIRWYGIAYDNQYGVDALREYAYALKRAERYQEAMQAFKELGIEIGSPYEYRREISACEVALGWSKLPPEYEIELMPFNTSASDYAPVLYRNNKLVFTSDRQDGTGNDTYNWTGRGFSDLFVFDPGTERVTSFDPELNTKDNEGTATFSPDFSELFFTRCYGDKREDAFCKILYSQAEGESWSPPRLLNFIREGVNYLHPSLSADGSTLYFASDDPDGWGGWDIYGSDRQDDGLWGKPYLLSRAINTPNNEKFPFIDGDTLYFASDGHTGMGGLDIFRTFRMNGGNWAPVQNLRPPINSGGDDFGFIIDYHSPRDTNVLQMGYFTSTRQEGLGSDDIFRFRKIIPPPLPPEEVAKEPEPQEYKLILEGYVVEKILSNPLDPNSRVLGRKPLPGSKVAIQFGRFNETVTVDEDGMFRLELQEQMDYSFLASRDGYLRNDATFSTKGIGRDPAQPVQVFEIEIVLDKIFFDREIRLENIYYDFDKWDIREDAKPTLIKLARNLELNPDIRIQLGSHTDCRGTARYNEDLSRKRAQSAVDYLISLGIDPGRLEARGYGESQPEIDCICNRCTEEEHQQNRRTTFKIVE
jgi:outer membrane protein OmpA-like peptidoglycan-associated protein/tetratricopeptide (TPR) repeat protein